MPIEDLPEPIRALIDSKAGPRWEEPGRYHVTEVLHCLVKAQLNHHFNGLAIKGDERIPEAFGRGRWAPFRGILFHEAFEEVMGTAERMEYVTPVDYGEEGEVEPGDD